MSKYSHEQAEEILRRALSREPEEGISHEDLVSAAREVGIEPEQIETAAREVADEARAAARQNELRDELRRGLGAQVAGFVATNTLVLVVDLLTGPGFFVQWVLLGTGLLLLRRLRRALWPTEYDLRRAAKRIARRERKRHWETRRHHEEGARKARRRRTEAQFERVVEEGVEALLRSAAERLERWNREQDGPRVRVATDDDAAEANAAQADQPTRRTQNRRR